MASEEIGLELVGGALSEILAGASGFKKSGKKAILMERYLGSVVDLYGASGYLPLASPGAASHFGFPARLVKGRLEEPGRRLAEALQGLLGDDVDPSNPWDLAALTYTGLLVLCGNVYHGEDPGTRFRLGKLSVGSEALCSLFRLADKPWLSSSEILEQAPLLARDLLVSYSERHCEECAGRAGEIRDMSSLKGFKAECGKCYQRFSKTYSKVILGKWRAILSFLQLAKWEPGPGIGEGRPPRGRWSWSPASPTLPARLLAGALRAFSWVLPDYKVIGELSRAVHGYYRMFPRFRAEIARRPKPGPLLKTEALQDWALGLSVSGDTRLIANPLRPDEASSDLASYALAEAAHRAAAQRYAPGLAERFPVFLRVNLERLATEHVVEWR